jgi:hypothetical protein
MGIFARIFGSGKKQPEKKQLERPGAAPLVRSTPQSAPASNRLTYEKAEDFSAILQFCSEKKKQGNEYWPSPTLIRQLRKLMSDAPVRSAPSSPLKLTRQLPALWKNRQDLIVTENLEFKSSVTGDFQTVVEGIMDKVGHPDKLGVFVSLHGEPDVGVTVNCHALDGVFSLLVVKLPSSRFALYSCLQKTGDDAAQGKAAGPTVGRQPATLDRLSEVLSMPHKEFQKYLEADLQEIKAYMMLFAQGGKTMEFLAESSKRRDSEISEISETAADVLVSEPAFAETLAKELATFYTYVRDRLGQGNDIAGEVRAKELMKPEEVMNMGRAAHLLMRAMRRDPKLGNRTAVVDSLRRIERSSDPFVSDNAVEALKIFRDANRPPPPPSPQQLGQAKPSGVVPGRRSPGGGYLCPYCGKGHYEPYPASGSPNRRCKECSTVFSTTSLSP